MSVGELFLIFFPVLNSVWRAWVVSSCRFTITLSRSCVSRANPCSKVNTTYGLSRFMFKLGKNAPRPGKRLYYILTWACDCVVWRRMCLRFYRRSQVFASATCCRVSVCVRLFVVIAAFNLAMRLTERRCCKSSVVKRETCRQIRSDLRATRIRKRNLCHGHTSSSNSLTSARATHARSCCLLTDDTPSISHST